MNTGKETGRYTGMQGFSTEQRSREGETTTVKDIKRDLGREEGRHGVRETVQEEARHQKRRNQLNWRSRKSVGNMDTELFSKYSKVDSIFDDSIDRIFGDLVHQIYSMIRYSIDRISVRFAKIRHSVIR
jgi:predicted transcriptional regulator